MQTTGKRILSAALAALMIAGLLISSTVFVWADDGVETAVPTEPAAEAGAPEIEGEKEKENIVEGGEEEELLDVAFTPLLTEESADGAEGENVENVETEEENAVEAEPEKEMSQEDYLYSSNRSLEEIELLIGSENYSEYSKRYADKPIAKESVIIDATDYLASDTTADVSVTSEYEGVKALYVGETGKVSWEFDVPDSAKYAVKITYYNAQGTNTTIERLMFIDDRLPFAEARYLYLPRAWQYEYNANGRFDVDINGNDIRPVRSEYFKWTTYFLRDWLGYNQNPFEIYLTEGSHKLTFEGAREPIVISQIELYPYAEDMSYADRLQQWKDEGYEVVTDVEPVKAQFDEPYYVSNQNMFPGNDRTSCLTEPQSPTKIVYNILDFATANSFAVYNVNVPKTGLYKISVRFRQNSLIGLFTSRRIYINDEVPFKEAGYCRFVYNTAFQVTTLGDPTGEHPENDFYFLLHEGDNEIKFEAVLGDMSKYVTTIETMVEDLTEAYQKILMITGPSPDTNRDYGFKRIVPDCLETLAVSAEQLYGIVDELVAITGEKGDQVATLESYALLFRKMAIDEYEIPDNMANFKSYIVSLSQWMYSILSQPVKLDYFVVRGEDDEPPAATANIAQTAWFEVRAFFGSFFMDYTTIGFASDSGGNGEASAGGDGETLVMWATEDRETSLIKRRIIDSYFTPQTGITVTIKVITAGLQNAIIAGIGPDISFMSTTDTITWGLRTAVQPLNDYEGFDDVISEFPEVVIQTLSMEDENHNYYTYGLPTGLTMNMMYYRVDVLAELGIEVPRTWDELYDCMSVIQNKRLQVGLPIDPLTGLKLFLYQQNIELFTDEYVCPDCGHIAKTSFDVCPSCGKTVAPENRKGWKINLDSNEALSAFESYTNFFTKYDSPVSWATDRFRTGEIPIMVGDAVTTYNELMGYYDLRGLWEMTPILGTAQPDGTIDYTSVITTSAIIIPRGAHNNETSWKYISWYVGEECQRNLVRESIAVSGPTTKMATPNIDVFVNAQPWTEKEKAAIEFQVQHLASVPEYPGIYIVSTYVNSAFQSVYGSHSDPSEEMLDRVMDINKEITRKRIEFGMEAYDLDY